MGKTIIFFILVFAMFSSACTTQVSYVDDVEDKTPLKIYLISGYGGDNDNDIIKNVESYNILNDKDDLDIEVVEYSADEVSIMYEDILNEVSIGKGPDFILFNSMINKYIDISKISQQNAFADMEILIENSESFDITKYNQAALDAGATGNKRIFMPISYRVEYMMAVEECFENNYLEVPDRLTIDAYLDLLEAYYQYKKGNPALLGTDIEYLLAAIINDEGKFNNDTLTERIFEILKNENLRIDRADFVEVFSYNDNLENVKNFVNNNYMFIDTDSSGLNQFKEIHMQYNFIENMYNCSFRWYEYPISKDGKPLAYVDRGLAININSKHKNEAFKFVEYMLSDAVQSNVLYMTNFPVNRRTYERRREEFIEGYDEFVGYEGEGGVYSNFYFPNETTLPDTLVDDYLEYIESAEEYKYLGNIRYVYHNILRDIIEDYYNDRISFEDLIDGMNSKLGLYYSE